MGVGEVAEKVVIGTVAGVCGEALGLQDTLHEAVASAMIGTGLAGEREQRRRATTKNQTGKGRQ